MKTKNLIKKISNKYLLNGISSYIPIEGKILLNIIKYNKKCQKKFNISLYDYQKEYLSSTFKYKNPTKYNINHLYNYFKQKNIFEKEKDKKNFIQIIKELYEDEEKEEEKEEEEKEDSQEDEKDSNKISNTVNYSPKNISLKIQNENKPKEEEEKIPNNYKQETPIKTTKIEKEEHTPENQDQDLEATSTYILKYTRKGDELKELAEETGLRKSENCLFMLNIKLIKSDSVSIIDPTEEGKEQEETPKEPENFLVFCCHEIAAIYFDEIYERIYTLKDLALENKYFKVF